MLPGDHDQSGASRRPPVAAAASAHTGSSPTLGQRDHIASNAPITAATASANTEDVAAGGTGSTPTPTSSEVNVIRTCSARRAKRRSQPRTVSIGRSTTAAALRAPTPTARKASAAPITDTASARRSSAQTGSNTCDTPHPPQRDRRGRSTIEPLASRKIRVRAQPHGRNESPQPGHANPPSTSRSSTRAASTPTVSTAPPRATRPSRTHSAKRHREGLSYALIGTVPPPTNTTPVPAHTKIRRHPQCPESAPHVGILSAAQHGDEALRAALGRAVAFGRWRAADVRSILAAGAGTADPRPAGDALVLELPVVPVRALADYAIDTTTITGGAR